MITRKVTRALSWMIPRRRALPAVVMTLVLAGGGLAPGFAHATDPSPERVAEATKFRETFGLRADSAFVQRMASQEATPEYGVALTPAEKEDLDWRFSMQHELGALGDYGSARSETFGGIHIDQQRGGVVVASFTDDTNLHLAALEPLLPAGATLEVRLVEHTLAQLQALTQRLADDADYQASIGAKVLEAGPRVRDNRVEVGLRQVTPEIEAAFHERYGDDVLEMYAAKPVQRTACNSRYDCIGPPLRGGISAYNNDNGFHCTLGFLGTQSGEYRWAGAGHCGANGHYWTHNGLNIGTQKTDVYYTGSNADAMTVGDISPTYTANWVYYNSSLSSLVLAKQGWNTDYEGQGVCMSGRVSLWTCGNIYMIGFWFDGDDGIRIYQQRSATYNVAVGDSGSPTLADNVAYGINNGINSAGRGIYSHIYWIEYQLGWQVYLGN